MTQTGYTNAIVNAMLGWLKGFAGWVLKLFNLSTGFSPLRFLADNWLKLLVFFLILGVVVDLLVWLIRWRPHWVWFRKIRVVINDKNFFAQEKYIDDSDDWGPDASRRPAGRKPRRNWEDSEYVVPGQDRVRREERQRRRAERVQSMQMDHARSPESTDVFRDGLFNVNAKHKFSDKYEDEVFSVNDLPEPEKRPSRDRRPVRRSSVPAGVFVRNRIRKILYTMAAQAESRTGDQVKRSYLAYE